MSERSESFFHGTTAHLRPGDNIAPNRKPMFPSDTERGYTYATPHEDKAWSYAEKAWHSSDSGHPRVYEVAPTGAHEPDPLTDQHGRMRGNYEGDRRSQSPWRVLSERQMPEHMGTPEDWR